MNYASIKNCDVANGQGVRISLFVSGCTHHCKNCFNAEAWDFNYGNPFTPEIEEQILELLSPSYIAGLTLLGGEPMEPCNQKVLLPFIQKVKERFPEKTIWCYSGYLFDQQILNEMTKKYDFTLPLISLFDVMVDGKYVDELHDLKLQFRGSSNQRIIDVQQSLKENKVIPYQL